MTWKPVGMAGEGGRGLVQFGEEEGEVFSFRCGRLTASGGLSIVLFGKPILVVRLSPAGEIIFIEGFAGVAEVEDDSGIGQTITEHDVDLLADRVREAGNFAGTPSMQQEPGAVPELSWGPWGHFIRERV